MSSAQHPQNSPLLLALKGKLDKMKGEAGRLMNMGSVYRYLLKGKQTFIFNFFLFSLFQLMCDLFSLLHLWRVEKWLLLYSAILLIPSALKT